MDELTRFVRKALEAGKSREDIREALGQFGWRSDEITATLSGVKLPNWGNPSMPTDPETRADYQYKPLDRDHFQLCANFDSDTMHESDQQLRDDEGYFDPDRQSFLRHNAGRNCFTLSSKAPNP